MRAGGDLTLYPRGAALRLRRLPWRRRRRSSTARRAASRSSRPRFSHPDVPIVQVVHHVHQDQFATRFSPPMAAVGRFLEGRVARAVYGSRTTAAVSPSTRVELRRRLGFTGPIFVVPNGTGSTSPRSAVRATRIPRSSSSRGLVRHKRVDLLLGEIAPVSRGQVPRLRVEIVGERAGAPATAGPRASTSACSGPWDLARLPTRRRSGTGCSERAWLTTSTSAAEGWGVLNHRGGRGWGVPCVALRRSGRPGLRGSDGSHRLAGSEHPAQIRDVGGGQRCASSPRRTGHARSWQACQAWARWLQLGSQCGAAGRRSARRSRPDRPRQERAHRSGARRAPTSPPSRIVPPPRTRWTGERAAPDHRPGLGRRRSSHPAPQRLRRLRRRGRAAPPPRRPRRHHAARRRAEDLLAGPDAAAARPVRPRSDGHRPAVTLTTEQSGGPGRPRRPRPGGPRGGGAGGAGRGRGQRGAAQHAAGRYPRASVGVLSYACTLLMAHLLPAADYSRYSAAVTLIGGSSASWPTRSSRCHSPTSCAGFTRRSDERRDGDGLRRAGLADRRSGAPPW